MTLDLMFLNENEVQSFIQNGYTIAKGTSIRMISNMYVHLKQHACFERPDGDYSPYERAIVAALESAAVPFDFFSRYE